MKFLQGQTAAILALWLVLVVVSLFSRSYIPIDETRYVTVAWNMWLRGDYLVPWLNDAPYSHKPPLLFWLMNAGWAVFGVNDWWPRLVPSFFALGSVLLTAKLARMLWPEDRPVADMAPLILLGSALWVVFTTATMFDMMIALFTLLGMLGILIAWQGRPVRGWALVGLAIGLGLLAKGPTIFLQILPVALLAPWWTRGKAVSWGRWYAGMLASVAMGAAIALLWAIPAGMRGGEEYRNAIFWGQTAERMVNSFAHKRPLWWYLPLLSVMLFPWLLWAPVWRGLYGLRRRVGEAQVRFCLAWLVPVFVAFCFVSGKQMHYLLPVFPAFALLVARTLPESGYSRSGYVLPASLVMLAGAVLYALPSHAEQLGLPVWAGKMEGWRGLVVAVAGFSLLTMRISRRLPEIWKLTMFSALSVSSIVYYAGTLNSGLAFDIRPLGRQLKVLQDAGVPLTHVEEYAGQYQFVGRLVDEPEIIGRNELSRWFKAHPDGKAIVYFRKRRTLEGVAVDYQQPYLDHIVAILGREAWPVPSPRAP